MRATHRAHPPRPAPGATRDSLRRWTRLLVAGLIAAVAVTGVATAADPAPTPPDTLAARVHTATADGRVVDAPAYRAATDVHLVARTCGPESAPLAAGDYVFAVFDQAGALRSRDALADRRFTVDAFGRISAARDAARSTRTICPGNGAAFLSLAVTPFTSDDAAPADRFWLRVATAASADACVRAGEPTGFGCDTVERTSVPFAVDPAASPAPTASGLPSSSASGSSGPSAPAATPTAGSPSPGSPEPTVTPTAPGSPDPGSLPAPSDPPGASGLPSTPASPSAPPSSTPTPSPSPTAPPTATASPSPTAPATGTPEPAGSPSPAPTTPPGGVTVPTVPPRAGGGGPVWTPPVQPTAVPYSLPPGAFICPGQLITPTGCQTIDSPGTAGPGATPAPSWSWGAAPPGVPVFPGINAPASAGPGGPGVPGIPVAPGAPGMPPASGSVGPSVEASVDLAQASTAPSGSAVMPSPSVSVSASAVASGAGATTAGASGSAETPAAPGAVAGVTNDPQSASRPPQPAPAGTLAQPSPPSLPIVLAVILIVLAGATGAAMLGWARRHVRGPRGAAAADHGSVGDLIRRVRHRFGRAAGLRPR